MINLYIDETKIISENSYSMSIEDRYADSSGETEAGTKQYDYIRKNVHTISLSYTVTDYWLSKLSDYRYHDTLQISFYDELSRKQIEIMMKMVNFKYDLKAKTKKRNIWAVSFDLEEI